MARGLLLRLFTHPTRHIFILRQGKAPIDEALSAPSSNTFELSNNFCIVHELQLLGGKGKVWAFCIHKSGGWRLVHFLFQGVRWLVFCFFDVQST
jgi:hypothetical protein